MPGSRVKVSAGDVVRLRKSHPCGSHEWKVVRVGMDIGLVCAGCSHKVMMKRSAFEKAYRCHVGGDGDPDER